MAAEYLIKSEAESLWKCISATKFTNCVLARSFHSGQNFSEAKISLTAEYSITLEQLVEFHCNCLCGSGSGDSSINKAVKLLLPVVKSSIQIETSHKDLEKISFPELVNKVIAPLSRKVVMEKKKYGEVTWAENVTKSFLGLGTKETLHGQPDCRVRGCVEGETGTELVSVPQDRETELGYSSDAGIDGKRWFESKYISQLISTNITCSFTEKKLHATFHSLIPSIMLNTSSVRVSLYDCTSDLLFLSDPVKILVEDNDSQDYNFPIFASPAALFIWLFINHRLFVRSLTVSGGLKKSEICSQLIKDGVYTNYENLNAKTIDWSQKQDDSSSSDYPILTLDNLPPAARRRRIS